MTFRSINKKTACLISTLSSSLHSSSSRMIVNRGIYVLVSKLSTFSDFFSIRVFGSIAEVFSPPSIDSLSSSDSKVEDGLLVGSKQGEDKSGFRRTNAQAASEKVDFRKIEVSKLPTVVIVGRPNVGKSALFHRLIRIRHALVYNTPDGHVTRDIREGVAKLGDLRFRVLDSAGLETASSPGDILMRTAKMTCKMLLNSAAAIFLIDARLKAYALYRVIHAIQNNKITGIPVVFVSALERRGRMTIMRTVIDTYDKWCLRLPTARLNRWLRKVMSRHSWKDQAAQPKIKYFTQVKARPPTFVAFTSGSVQLPDTYIRFLTKSLKEDFDIGGIPVHIIQRCVPRKAGKCSKASGHIMTSCESCFIRQKVVTQLIGPSLP